MSDCEFCTPGGQCPGEHRDYICTRPLGHKGPHVACAGDGHHDIVRWGEDGHTLTQEQFDDALKASLPKPAPIKEAIRDWQELAAKSQPDGEGEYGYNEFANRLEADNALDRVSAAARATVEPHVAAALELAGYRLCMDTLAIGGADDLPITLERLKRDLAASACSCGGSGEIIKAGFHPNDPAAAMACPECHGGDKL